MTQALKIGVVGCGGIAQAYLQAGATVDGLTFAAMCEPDPERRDKAVAEHGGKGCESLDALLEMDLDAVLVLTPPCTHEDITVRLLGRGLHVLCEKPLAPEIAAAERMIGAAADAGRVLMMGSKFRYVEDMSTARKMIDDGVIGDVLMFENAFCSHVDMTRRWNSKLDVSGGGVLIDNGCHSVDIARFLLGPIRRVQAWTGKQVQPIEVEDTAQMLFESESGTLGTIDLSWSLSKAVSSFVRLYGSQGNLEIGWKRSRYMTADQPEWMEFGDGYSKLDAFRAQLENFVGVIRGTAAPLITAADALASVKVITTAYRSAAEDRWHDVR